MDIAAIIRVAFVCCLLAGAGAFAAGEIPDPPTPTDLSADWWDYISASPEDQRPARLARLRDVLETLKKASDDPAVRASASNAVGSVDALLVLMGRSGIEPEPPSTIEQSYTFPEMVDFFEAEREAELESNLLDQQLQRDVQASSRAEGRLSDKKAAYLRRDSADPGHTLAGLQIVEDRLQLAVQREEQRLQKARLENWKSREANNKASLDAATELLEIDPKAIDTAEKRVARNRAEAERHADEARQLRARAYAADAQTGEAGAKLAAIELIAAETREAESESVARRYELQLAYLGARLDASKENLATLRRRRGEAVDFVSDMNKQVAVWREVATRERQRALQTLTDPDGAPDAEQHGLVERRKEMADDALRSLAQIDVVHRRIGFIEQLSAKYLASYGGSAADLFPSLLDGLQNGWSFVKRWSNASLFEINETPVTLFGIFRVVIIFVVAIWVSKLIRHTLEQFMSRGSTMSRSSVYMLGRIFHYIILIAAVLVSLSSLGLDFTKLAFIAGALGVGIGFGLQAIFSNFVSGIIVLFERSLKVGDYVELESGVTGEVREINIRSTLITTNDNVDILVPNSEFVNGRVINWTLRDAHRRARVPFGVAYGTDKELVRKAGLEAADNVKYTLHDVPNRGPQVWLTGFGDSSLNFELVVWLTADAVVRPGAVNAAYTWEIETALGKYGIEIPFPQRDLNVRSFFGRKDGEGLKWFDEACDGNADTPSGGAGANEHETREPRA
jgi:small-conductance mechanosensitive channel